MNKKLQTKISTIKRYFLGEGEQMERTIRLLLLIYERKLIEINYDANVKVAFLKKEDDFLIKHGFIKQVNIREGHFEYVYIE